MGIATFHFVTRSISVTRFYYANKSSGCVIFVVDERAGRYSAVLTASVKDRSTDKIRYCLGSSTVVAVLIVLENDSLTSVSPTTKERRAQIATHRTII